MPSAVSPPTSRSSSFGAVLAGLLVALFAFLLASFPVRDSGIWGHLASGRDLAHGRGGAASFAPPTDAGWLFDLSCYAAYALAGPTGLVVGKAVLVAGLALVLYRLSRPGSGVLIAAFSVGLAMLAMGTRLHLQPALASVLFLGLALWALEPRANPALRQSFWPAWPLVAIFILWANTDRWFLVGLAVVALVRIGRALDRPSGERGPALVRGLAGVVILAAAALLNPSHVGAFQLPPGLTAAGPVAGGARAVTSPFSSAYLEVMAQTPAGLACFPLMGLGLLSFALPPGRSRWERLLPWLGLAVLTAFQVRAVPFLAVVSAPVLARNLHDFFARRAAAAGELAATGRRGRVVLAAVAGVLAVAFVMSAWTGWLQGPPFGPRRWGVQTPPGLEQGAQVICQWQSAGRLGPQARGLHVSSDTVAAFAWFCPAHQAVADPTLVAAVLGAPGAPADWADRLRAAGINHVIVYDTDRRRMTAALTRLFADPVQWPVLRLDGGVTIFGWRGAAAAGPSDPFRTIEWDADRLAVWPVAGERAPPARPANESDPRRWWEVFWKSAPTPSDDRDTAAVYLLKAESLRQSAPVGHLAAWEATQAAGLIAGGAGWSDPTALADAYCRLEFFRPAATASGGAMTPVGRLAQSLHPGFARARGDTPAAVLYLAVRAARRAVADNPADAQAYALLGETYLRLAANTREQLWGRYMPELLQLRRAQAATALTRAVSLAPDLARAHLQLAALYGEMGFADLALNHQHACLAAVRKAVDGTVTASEDYRAMTSGMAAQIDRLADVVEEREREFAQQAAELRVYDRAVIAKEKGLVGKARDILLNSDISAFGANGMALELELLVRTGRVKEVLDWTAEEHAEALGPLYQWLRAQAFAASGDYALAREELTRLAAVGMDSSAAAADPRAVMSVLVGQGVADGHRGPPGNMAGLVWDAYGRAKLQAQLGPFVLGLRREADALTLRGLVALEEGDAAAAAGDFRRALRTWGSGQAVREGRGIDFLGRPAAQQALAWIESVPARP